jgi:hypothetical protein
MTGCRIWLPLRLLLALAGAGCGGGIDPSRIPVEYQFALNAVGGDTTVERARTYDCTIYGYFRIPQPLSPSGTARFPVYLERRLYETRGEHFETTSADTSIAEAVLDYTGLGGDSLQFVLGAGSYTVSLGPGGRTFNNPTEYAGDWSCGPEVPLGQDSTLLAYGYGASLRLAGTWRVSEMLPID